MGINLKNFGWDEVEASEGGFVKLPVGGYVCKIVNAVTEPLKGKGLRLTADVDIAEGEFANYFSQNKLKDGRWSFNAQFMRYVVGADRKVTPAFKGFMKRLEKENPNFRFNESDFDAQQFINLICGFTFGEREYLDKDGNLRTSVTIRYPESVDKIRVGDFKIPPIEKLPPDKRPAEKTSDEDFGDVELVSDDQMPF